MNYKDYSGSIAYVGYALESTPGAVPDEPQIYTSANAWAATEELDATPMGHAKSIQQAFYEGSKGKSALDEYGVPIEHAPSGIYEQPKASAGLVAAIENAKKLQQAFYGDSKDKSAHVELQRKATQEERITALEL
jgi:hypothetical protein